VLLDISSGISNAETVSESGMSLTKQALIHHGGQQQFLL
jgi:hypothetical protein